MLITRTEIILANYSHTNLLSVAVGRHFLSVYAWGMRLAPTFGLRHYDAKIKLVGASIKVWEWATVAKAIQGHGQQERPDPSD